MLLLKLRLRMQSFDVLTERPSAIDISCAEDLETVVM